jgi:L-histidine N-alpha-methyltransferase
MGLLPCPLITPNKNLSIREPAACVLCTRNTNHLNTEFRVPHLAEAVDPIAATARLGLTSPQKTLPPWLFYDELGSQFFEQITTLPEYYLTRTERALFEEYADNICLALDAPLTVVELGAGTATKTGILLEAATRFQSGVLYQPIDVSPSALDEAIHLESQLPGLTVRPQVANYVTESIRIDRQLNRKVLALYIGSSIGNFSPEDARAVLEKLRAQLRPGDALLLGTDLAPSRCKPIHALLAAYDDASGVTAAFNRNILDRLNRELGADFDLDCFTHQARWNPAESRIEMHLVSVGAQTVSIPANSAGPALILHFAPGESIHTENSYKFNSRTIAALLTPAGFTATRTFSDPDHLFAVTLATAT